MAVAVVMPRQGQSVETCILTRWFKKKGERVKTGEPLFAYDTDKASFEQEAEADGVLLDVFYEEDAEVPVLAVIAVIGEEGEPVDAFRPGGTVREGAGTAGRGEKADGIVVPRPECAEARTGGDVPRAGGAVSPRARRRAAVLGVDVRDVAGTGPGGRVVERDVEEAFRHGRLMTPAALEDALRSGKRAPEAGTGPGGRVLLRDLRGEGETAVAGEEEEGEGELVKLTSIRRIIGANMRESLLSSAQVTLHGSADARGLAALRGRIKEGKEPHLGDAGINDLVCFAVVRALVRVPEMNAHMCEEGIRVFRSVHLAVAVDTERGLMVPVVRNAERLSVRELAGVIRELVEECRTGAVDPEKLRGGTFTLSNLGMLGVEMFTPICNPPQVGILGVCSIVPRLSEDGTVVPRMGLSLTFDHRAVDGAPAARFLREVAARIENIEESAASGPR